jgi:3-dehydroquinate synthase
VDPVLLATLPARHRRAGLAEVVKIGFAADAPLFRWCERNTAALAAGESAALAEAVRRAIRAKARIVQADEREREGGVRTALNLGHTLGHAIEAAEEYRGMLHGEAVAVGLRAAARLSEREAGLPAAERERLERLLDALGLRHRVPGLTVRRLLAPMGHDKKRAPGGIRWVLTPRMGSASVPRLISGRLVRAVLLEVGART